MRILIANEFFYPDVMGGTPKLLSEFAAELRDTFGDDVDVVTSVNSYRDPAIRFPLEDTWGSIKIHRVDAPHWTSKSTPQRLLGNVMFSRKVARRLTKLPKADVLLVSTAPVTLPAAAMTFHHTKGVPYVYIIYDLDPDRAETLGVVAPGSAPAKLLRRHQSKWMHGAERIVVIGRCMRDKIARIYNLDKSVIDVVEVGADPNTVRPGDRDSAFRKEHGLTGFLLVYTGNFGKYHDFDTLLDSAKLLKDRGEEITFVLVGRGAKKAHLESRVAAEGLTNVRFFDFVPEEAYGDLLASADVCLVTLENGMEGLCVPSKFYSILASGRATLATMNPESEIAYVLGEADCGVRVGLADPQGIADALVKLKADPEGVDRMGRNARSVFDAKYSAPIVAAKLRESLKKAAG